MRVAVSVGALALLLAGCGGVEREPNLAQAVERTEAVGSTRFEVHGVEMEGAETLDVDCAGAADYGRKHIRVSCEYGVHGELEMRAIGDDLYLRGGEFLGFGGVDDKWIKLAGDSEEDSLQNFSPEQLLSMLRAASRDTERLGEEDVRGTSTVRYRLTVNCEEAELGCDGNARVDVWIDGDGLVRRIEIDELSAEWAFEFFDFGVEVDIEPPPADEVTEETSLGTGGITARPVVPCSGFEARPITQEAAIEALRRNGFSVGEGTCGLGPSLLTLTNNTGRDPVQTLKREGVVICHLLGEPRAEGAKLEVTGETVGASATHELANLRCTLFADKAPVKPKAERLKAAFAELERAIRP